MLPNKYKVSYAVRDFIFIWSFFNGVRMIYWKVYFDV